MQQHLFTPEYGFAAALNTLEVQVGVIGPRPFRFDPQPVLERYRERLNGCDNSLMPVISAEALSGSLLSSGLDARQNADRLLELFPRAKILLVTREQRGLLRSLYKSLVAWGSPLSIADLLAPKGPGGGREFHLDFLRFHLLARHYRKLYGEENVLVLPHELFKQTPREFVRRILEHCSMNATAALEAHPPFGRKVNKNSSLSALAYQRWLNRAAHAWSPGSAGPGDNEATIKRVNRRMRNFPSLPYLDTRLELRFARAVSELTRGQFADSNLHLQSITGIHLARYGYEMPAD